MKNNVIKRITAILIVLLIAASGIEIGKGVWLSRSRDEIIKYLDEYETGNATYEDVRAVNLHFKDYVKIGETDRSDLILSRSHWFFGASLMLGYKRIDRLGSGFIYEDSNKNTYSVIETDEWCPFFRVYAVTKGVIKE